MSAFSFSSLPGGMECSDVNDDIRNMKYDTSLIVAHLFYMQNNLLVCEQRRQRRLDKARDGESPNRLVRQNLSRGSRD
jgi:hypothetical protein